MQDIHFSNEDKNNISLKKKRSTAALLSNPDLGGIANKEASFKTAKNLNKTKRALHTKHFVGFIILAILLCLLFSGMIAYSNLKDKQASLQKNIDAVMIHMQVLKEHIDQKDYKNIKEDAQKIKTAIANSSKEVQQLSSQQSAITGDPLGTYAALFEVLEGLSDSLSSTINSIPDNLMEIDPLALTENINKSTNSLAQAHKKLEAINLLNIPPQHHENILQLKEIVKQSNDYAQEYSQLIPNILASLGYPDPKTYLVLFQNTGERRPTGGFIGSFALIDFNDGALTNLQVHDVYDFDARLFQKIKAPESLAPYRDHIALRDSNHNPDFPSTAQSASWFLEHEGGPSVDGVIAIDEQFLASLLDITGKIKLETDFGKLTFTSQNYFELLEYIIESSKDHPNTPKQVLIDLVFTIKEKLEENPQQYSQDILLLFKEKISQKDIQIYFKDPILQDLSKQLNADNTITTEATDAVAVLLTSLSGNKSDKYVDYSFKHETKINSQKEIINSLQIKAEHNWSQENTNFFYRQFPDLADRDLEKQKEIISIIGEGPNITLHRILVPQGSEIVYTAGIPKHAIAVRSYNEQFDSLEFLLETKREQAKQVNITYKIPHTNKDNYSFEWIKQPGHTGYTLDKIWDDRGTRIKETHNVISDLYLRFPL